MKLDRDGFIKIIENNSDVKINALSAHNKLSELGVDSLGFATLLFEIEDHFGIKINEEELQGLGGEATVSDFIEKFKKLGCEIEI
ncbi:MAG: acyl carrier protein [Gallionella sp.]